MAKIKLDGVRIAAIPSDNNACGNYRVRLPLQMAEKYGAKVDIYAIEDSIPYDEIARHDIIILQRVVDPNLVTTGSILTSAGKLVVMETDDMLDRIHATNVARKAYTSERLLAYNQAMQKFSGVTVTTPLLVEHYHHVNPNITAVPNMIDFDIRKWPEPKFNVDRPIRIGWTGSTSHTCDIDIIGPVLAQVMAKYPNTEYVHFSDPFMLEYLRDHYGLPADRLKLVDIVPFAQYPMGLANFDIGLAPLANTEFNRAKSYLKVMEYSACGIPFVASRVGEYLRYTDPGQDGFLCGNTAEWVEAVSTLVEDTQRRREMGQYAYEKAREQHDLGKHFYKWVAAWSFIVYCVKNNITTEQSMPKVKRNDPCPCGSGVKYKRCQCYPAHGRG